MEPYEEDGFVGQQITFDEVSLEDFTREQHPVGRGSGRRAGHRAERVTSSVVSGAIDMSGQEFTGTEVPEEFMDNFEFRVSITFPGEVKSATGDIDGNTVTWEPTIGENTRVEAVASAIPSASSPLLMILLIAAGRARPGRGRVLPHPPQGTCPGRRPMGDATTMPIEGVPPMPGGPSDPVAPVEPPPGGPEAP